MLQAGAFLSLYGPVPPCCGLEEIVPFPNLKKATTYIIKKLFAQKTTFVLLGASFDSNTTDSSLYGKPRPGCNVEAPDFNSSSWGVDLLDLNKIGCSSGNVRGNPCFSIGIGFNLSILNVVFPDLDMLDISEHILYF